MRILVASLAALAAVCSVASLSLAQLPTPGVGGPRPPDTPGNVTVTDAKDDLAKRVAGFYAALDQGRFAEAWLFFGQGMREDTRQADYVEQLTALILGAVPRGESKIEMGTTGKERRPLGKVTTLINIRARNGQTIAGVQTLTWVWQRDPAGAGNDWFLAAEELKTASPLGAVPNDSPVRTVDAPVSR